MNNNKKEFLTLDEETYYNQLQEAISLLRSIYSDRIDTPEMNAIGDFLSGLND